jgi:hypothetical protein
MNTISDDMSILLQLNADENVALAKAIRQYMEIQKNNPAEHETMSALAGISKRICDLLIIPEETIQ